MDALDGEAVSERRYAACSCDFCTGKKRWADNWCPRCAEVVMSPPLWWENLDVCLECQGEMGYCTPPGVARWADDGGRES